MPLKSQILGELETHRAEAISGQALAQRFGVSRNAVWKAVNALKADGYAIESAPNRGYRLATDSDRLSEEGIRAALHHPSLPVYCYVTLDSTNNEAKRRLAGGEVGPFMVAAEGQTAGRGRLGRAFFSPGGTGLYMTVALAAGRSAEEALGVTAYAAVCVARAVQQLTGLQAQIKWVNDLYLNGKKVCGILTEAVTDFESGTLEALLVGVGINLRPAPMPLELQAVAGSLNCDIAVKNRLAAMIAASLLLYPPANAEYLAEYRARSLTLGRRVRWAQGDRNGEGLAVEIDKQGALVMQAPDGSRQTLRSGEVTLLPPTTD
jgi:BirA family transcriptional regulator, biotin operon repressor / biotin---[acetyl-CoA-carboxylase] ligase